MEGYRKIDILRDLWENPQNYEISPSEKIVLNELESFMNMSQAYYGKIICGNHGVGKTFTVRYFLSKIGLLDDLHYVKVNNFVLTELKRRGINLALKSKLNKITQNLIKNVEPILVLDACEVLRFLNPEDFMTFVGQAHYSKTRILLILPTELDPGLPSITIYFPPLSEDDHKTFLQNFETTEEIPSRSMPFTYMIKKVMT